MAQTLVVDTTLDLPDAQLDGKCEANLGMLRFCTLRAAVQESNWSGSEVTIELPAGHYRLTRAGVGGNDSQSVGDLDVLDPVAIVGVGGVATIDAQGIDRVFEIRLNGFDELVSFTSVRITGGAAVEGGGIYLDGGEVFLQDSIVIGNTAQQGGGVYGTDFGLLRTLRSAIRDNVATLAGGGIYGLLNADIEWSEITGNQSPTGSAMVGPVPSVLNFYNATISGNGGVGNSGGTSALYVRDRANLRNTTLQDNQGAALFVPVDLSIGEVELDNSIVWGGCSGPIIVDDLGGNLEGPGDTCDLDELSNVVAAADPGLRPLAHYGGPTRTHAVDASSPARGIALACGPDDQRQAPRSSPSCDAGAFEFGAQSPLAGLFGDGFESGNTLAW